MLLSTSGHWCISLDFFVVYPRPCALLIRRLTDYFTEFLFVYAERKEPDINFKTIHYFLFYFFTSKVMMKFKVLAHDGQTWMCCINLFLLISVGVLETLLMLCHVKQALHSGWAVIAKTGERGVSDVFTKQSFLSIFEQCLLLYLWESVRTGSHVKTTIALKQRSLLLFLKM